MVLQLFVIAIARYRIPLQNKITLCYVVGKFFTILVELVFFQSKKCDLFAHHIKQSALLKFWQKFQIILVFLSFFDYYKSKVFIFSIYLSFCLFSLSFNRCFSKFNVVRSFAKCKSTLQYAAKSFHLFSIFSFNFLISLIV